jgi:hypothetical protein
VLSSEYRHPFPQNITQIHKGGIKSNIKPNELNELNRPNVNVPQILGESSGHLKLNTLGNVVSLPMSSAGSTVIRLLGYGFYEDNAFERPYANELRNISSEGCCVLNHVHYDKVVRMGDRSLRSFFVDGIKYVCIYDPDTDRFFTQHVPREGSDFFTTELEAFRKLHCEPDITGRFPKKLSGYPGTDRKFQTGKVYDLYRKYGDIDTKLIMDTIGIHFGLIHDDIDPQTMTQDDLDYYFYDRTGINISLFELFRLQQYQKQTDNTSSQDTLKLEKEERKFLEPQPQENLLPSKVCENKPEKCEKSLGVDRNLLPLCPIVSEVRKQRDEQN